MLWSWLVVGSLKFLYVPALDGIYPRRDDIHIASGWILGKVGNPFARWDDDRSLANSLALVPDFHSSDSLGLCLLARSNPESFCTVLSSIRISIPRAPHSSPQTLIASDIEQAIG